MKRGNFYKFVAYLLDHEYTKAREFDLLIESGGTTGPEKKKRDKDRAQKIAESTAQLDKGEIEPAIFLTRVISKQNGMCPADLDDFSRIDDVHDSDEYDSADETDRLFIL